VQKRGRGPPTAFCHNYAARRYARLAVGNEALAEILHDKDWDEIYENLPEELIEEAEGHPHLSAVHQYPATHPRGAWPTASPQRRYA
jgi:hypothetical protein